MSEISIGSFVYMREAPHANEKAIFVSSLPFSTNHGDSIIQFVSDNSIFVTFQVNLSLWKYRALPEVVCVEFGDDGELKAWDNDVAGMTAGSRRYRVIDEDD